MEEDSAPWDDPSEQAFTQPGPSSQSQGHWMVLPSVDPFIAHDPWQAPPASVCNSTHTSTAGQQWGESSGVPTAASWNAHSPDGYSSFRQQPPAAASSWSWGNAWGMPAEASWNWHLPYECMPTFHQPTGERDELDDASSEDQQSTQSQWRDAQRAHDSHQGPPPGSAASADSHSRDTKGGNRGSRTQKDPSEDDQKKMFEFPKDAQPPSFTSDNPMPLAQMATVPWQAIAPGYVPPGNGVQPRVHDLLAGPAQALVLAEQYAMRTMKHPKKVPVFDSKLAMPPKAKPAASEVCPRNKMTLQDTHRQFCASIQAADDAQREKGKSKTH